MTKFILNKSEIEYIKLADFIDEQKKHKILNIEKVESQIEDLEAIFSERLQKVGFDKDYQTTEEGKLLENLLDKLSNL